MGEPYTLTLSEMIAAIRSKKISPVELVQSLLTRIDSLESTVKAWVTIPRTSLLKEARRFEQEAARGKFRGPLHGIPIGVKDIFYTAGMRVKSDWSNSTGEIFLLRMAAIISERVRV